MSGDCRSSGRASLRASCEQRLRLGAAWPGSEGERQAAERARERIQARLRELEAEEPPIEIRFSLAHQWSRQLLVDLLRRYALRPCRNRGQRHTTVMACLSRAFVHETRWPEFLELQGTLSACRNALTDRLIEQALEEKAGEAEEQPQAAPAIGPQEHQGSLRWRSAAPGTAFSPPARDAVPQRCERHQTQHLVP